MTLNAALPSATSLPASCHVSDPASELVYVSSVLNRLSPSVTPLFDQSPLPVQSAAQRAGPMVEIIVVSSRCCCVHCSPSESGITPAAFAFFRTAGLYQRMFARWMFTGTEYSLPL